MIAEFLWGIVEFMLDLLSFGIFDNWLDRRKKRSGDAQPTSYWDREPGA